jgi:hypothetical protein
MGTLPDAPAGTRGGALGLARSSRLGTATRGHSLPASRWVYAHSQRKLGAGNGGQAREWGSDLRFAGFRIASARTDRPGKLYRPSNRRIELWELRPHARKRSFPLGPTIPTT